MDYINKLPYWSAGILSLSLLRLYINGGYCKKFMDLSG